MPIQENVYLWATSQTLTTTERCLSLREKTTASQYPGFMDSEGIWPYTFLPD